ncbi:MAG: L-arabinose transport system permease protein AraQ [Phycisphaerae bacterium]|nr:L-arabinose transport system permease protein AraQ [Phycisphaerae bacterium]
MTNRLGPVAKVVLHAALAVGAVTMIAPLVWQVGISFKPASELQSTNWIPHDWTGDNYAEVFRKVRFGRMILNSLFVATYITLLNLLTSTMAGYAFARLRFRGRDKLFMGYLATMMVPGAVTMIPTFILVSWFGLRNNYLGVILPAAFSVYGTFMMRQFFMGVPTDLEDAARMDGCGPWRVYLHIVLPLSKPAIATLATLTFISSWNSFLWPLLMLDRETMMTLPVGLSLFQDQSRMMGTDWGAMMAAATLVMIPIIVIFLFNQQYFVRGIRMGAIKG